MSEKEKKENERSSDTNEKVTDQIQSKDKKEKDKDVHKMAESNRAFAHFGRKRTKSK